MAAGEELFPAETDEQYRARMAHNARVWAHNTRVLAELVGDEAGDEVVVPLTRYA
ncbi:hypothetical protein M3G91_32060 [Micromonospora chalcea]|uniref:hypothetical protein n=1 Tax=Micromonospora chalcea TaxID=1874 RepID=UPI0021A3CFAC|nr:hypothetical protein [Micromonospora chalcea]MCT2282246.1 hypothetical protein [Micromonospora chalcea]